MLTSILDAGITEKVVRLGSRPTDERIAGYSLTNLEKKDSSIYDQVWREYDAKRMIEAEIQNVVANIQIPEPSDDQIIEYLEKNQEEHLSMMYNPPFWIAEYATRLWEYEREWTVQERKGKGKEQSHLKNHTYYGLWTRGLDIAFIQLPRSHFGKRRAKKKKGRKVQPSAQQEQGTYPEWVLELFYDLGFSDSVPPVPASNRPLAQLHDSPDVWSMSLEERKRLVEHWAEEMRRLAYHNRLEEYKTLRNEYEDACERYEAACDKVRA